MTITLEAIKSEHAKVAEMIATYEKQVTVTDYHIAGVTIPLAAGERFAGPVLNADGTLSHYLIKLPGEVTGVSHDDARRYALERGGVTPTKQEANLLRANLRDEFADAAYWLDEEYEGDSAYAWFQNFGYGGQGIYHGSAALRAVAVRRFIPSVI
ncbi:DUF1566 domain-containing protein [Burkholderia anthina]|uniref:DUF1566 domain-containing protein n=1 Tax=Burkholderia anthina TaxID=179879 RepID=UPI001AA0A422|nr:DUF1566 domain-containing protein [Burkholderia anthina]QTD88790.1 DUF1566 domain-containing protein [Burkholderia anthina]